MITISQKLKFILKISRLTQEKLASKLDVSFVTLNSWINEKSVPRKKAQERIDELYKLLTGQKKIPETELDAKKELVFKKASEHGNVFKKILENPDVYGQFVLSLTFNTNRIEGSALTENDTAAILFQNRALPNKTLTEQLEAKNHQTALNYLFKYLQRKSNLIDEKLILKLHEILMSGIRDDAGSYRRQGVRIVGANIPTANYLKIPELISKLFEDVSKEEKDLILKCSRVHSHFEKIHPFSDGNGRVGRLLMDGMFLKKNLPPPIVRQDLRNFYYISLQKSQLENDYSLLEDFVCDALLKSFNILEQRNAKKL